jgi:hypothetical protein
MSLRTRRRIRLVALGSAALAALLGAWALRDAGPARAHASEPARTGVRPAAAAAEQDAAAGARAGAPPTLDARAVRDYERRLAFGARVRAFLADAERLDAASRAREAAALEREIARYAAAGELSAGETFVLRTELIRAGEDDALVEADRLAELEERYRAHAERRVRDHAANPPAAFVAYKARERAIVDEVMAMRTIPGGVDRDEYLRRRLQAEREVMQDAPRH